MRKRVAELEAENERLREAVATVEAHARDTEAQAAKQGARFKAETGQLREAVANAEARARNSEVRATK